MIAPAELPVSSPKLLDRVRWHLRVKHYSIRTEAAYVDWIRRFILFHKKRHPDDMSEEQIGAYLTHLVIATASTIFPILGRVRRTNVRL